VPVALVLNELLTNAIKYAYPERRGTIEVSLARFADGRAALSVADGGVGLPDNFAERQGASLGFRIINGLVRQIHGEIEIKPRSPGVAFQVTFPADRP
jgi:two-component system, sensor histidine kinase PdtaS